MMDVNTYTLLEDQIQSNLNTIAELEPGDETRKALVHETEILIAKYNETERNYIEELDREGRRKLEERKADDALKIEEKKMDVPFKRMVLEASKVLIPAIVTVGSWVAYNKFQKRAIKFEETGSFTSAVGREVTHLPKILK